MKKETKPYVVSSDVIGLTERWCRRNNLFLPPKSQLEGMSGELQKTISGLLGTEVEIVPEELLRSGMIEKINKSKYPVISLDRAYLDDDSAKIFGFIDSTRAVDENLNDIGLVARKGHLKLEEQVKNISVLLRAKNYKDAALVDDVVYSGKCIIDLVALFKGNGIDIREVIAGIAVEEGIKRVNDIGVKIRTIREYKGVVDEVCERDFFAGVPFSGRFVVSKDGSTWSAPYFLPFGKPSEWASIPESCSDQFSDFCLEQSKYLWAKIEKASETEIPLRDLPRRLNLSEIDENTSVVKALNTISLSRRTD